MLITILVLIIVLGLLIFVHEFGHFIAAKKAGIKVEEFGFGYPPRIFGAYKDPKTKKFKFIKGSQDSKLLETAGGKKETVEKIYPTTVYSLNWLPLGGFCKMRGENEKNEKDSDSFGSKKPWVRTVVLIAGVVMNFALAAVLLMIGFKIGIPTVIDESNQNLAQDTKIQITQVVPDSPAKKEDLKIGDQILSINGQEIQTVNQVQEDINKNKGKKTDLKIKRFNEEQNIEITPRENPPENEGALGVGLVETGIVSYPWYTSIWKGIVAAFTLTATIIFAFAEIIRNLFTGVKVDADIAGPVGIAVLTGQMTKMGFVYLLQFTALLSINLAILNILPFPALDGGRILFITIGKIRRKPVSEKTENAVHTAGFALIILLMVVVTFRDVFKFKDSFINIWNNITNFF